MIVTIFVSVVLPIFLIIGLGFVLDRKLRLDLPTLSKLNFYVFVPALCFVMLLKAELAPAKLGWIGLFSLVHGALLFALAWGVFAHRALKPQQTILSLGTVFSNVGNYGIPLIVLAFGPRQVGVITVIVVVQNLLSFTVGIWLLERKTQGAGQVLRGLLAVPVVYAVALAIALQLAHVALPERLMTPLQYLADGLIPVALLTLGAQLSRTRLTRGVAPLTTVGVLRLLVSPALAAALVPLFGFTAPVSSVLIVAAAFPVGVNVFILAAQYRQDEELASQAIFWTTLLSAVTVSLLLLFVR